MATTKIARAVLELTTDAAAHLRELEKAKKANQGFVADTQRIGKSVQGIGSSMTMSITAPILAGVGALVVLEDKLGDSFDKIRLGTGATGAQLEDLQESFRRVGKEVPNDLGDVATAIADINTRTGLTGTALESLATKTLTLSRLAKEDLGETIRSSTRLFGDWSISTEDQGTALDTVWKTSQSTGIGVTELMDKVVQFGAPLRQFNFSFEESAALMGKWEKEGVNAELVLGSLRIAMGQFAKDGIPMRQGLDDTIKKIQALGPGAEATSLSMKTFGARAGPDMAAAILEGRFEIDELMKSIGDSPETVEAAADEIDGLQEMLQELGNKAMLAAEPLAKDLVRVLEKDLMPLAEDVIEFVSGMVKWFGDLPGPVRTASMVLTGVLALAGPGLFVAGTAIRGMGTALAFMGVGGTTAATGVTAADGALKRLILTLTANPIGLTLLTLGTGFAIAKSDMDAFMANMERQDAILKDSSLNLTAYGKSLIDAKPGVIDFSFATGGLAVNLDEVGVAATGAIPPTKALTEEQKKLASAFQSQVDVLTGKSLSREVAELARQYAAAERQGGLTEHQMDLLGKRLMDLRAQGAVLPPEFVKIEHEFARVNAGGLKVVRTIDSLVSVLGAVPGVTVPAKSALQKMADEMDKIQLHGLWGKDRAQAMVAPFQWAISGLPGTITKIGEAGTKSGSAFADGFAKSMEGIGNVVIGAIQGGGNVGAAVGAHIGKDLGGMLGSKLAGVLGGKALGKMLGSFGGPIGTLIGGTIGGKLASAIGNIGKNNTKAGREEAAKLLGFGSLGNLYDQLKTMGAEGAALAHQGLNSIGKKDTAANNAWIASVEALFKKTGELTGALATMRGELANLQAQSTPTWQQMQKAAEFLGIEINSLGPAFQQQRLTEQATEIWNAWDTLRLSGEDLSNHIGAMSGKLNEFVAESLTAGTKIPENFRVMLQQMADAGLLLDENGEHMDDLSRIQFGEAVKSEWEIVGEAINKLEAAIDRLVKQLSGDVVDAVGEVVGAFGRIPASMNFEARPNFGDTGGDDLAGFSAGTPGLDFLNFGKQRRVNLHGNEAVVPQGGGHQLAGEIASGLMSNGGRSGTSRPIVIHNRTLLDGREVARSTVQHLGEQMSLAGY